MQIYRYVTRTRHISSIRLGSSVTLKLLDSIKKKPIKVSSFRNYSPTKSRMWGRVNKCNMKSRTSSFTTPLLIYIPFIWFFFTCLTPKKSNTPYETRCYVIEENQKINDKIIIWAVFGSCDRLQGYKIATEISKYDENFV